MRAEPMLHWPQQLGRGVRRALDTGHKSFCVVREPAEDSFDRQAIQLKHHLLILVIQGSLIVESGGATVLLRRGDAAVLTDREFALTEIPVPGCSFAETHWFFFNDLVIGKRLRRMHGVERVAPMVKSPPLPIYLRPGFGQQLHGAVQSRFLHYPWEFSKILTALLNTSMQFLGFVKYGYLRRRDELQSFLIHHRLEYQTRCFAAVEDAYAGGRQALRRDCQTYLYHTPEQWMHLRSRMLDAFAKLKTGKERADAVASNYGYHDAEEFRRHFRQVNGCYPDEVARAPVPEARSPQFPGTQAQPSTGR